MSTPGCGIQGHLNPVRSCKRITVTEVVYLGGNGTEAEPAREITRFYNDDGRLLATNDPGRKEND